MQVMTNLKSMTDLFFCSISFYFSPVDIFLLGWWAARTWGGFLVRILHIRWHYQRVPYNRNIPLTELLPNAVIECSVLPSLNERDLRFV